MMKTAVILFNLGGPDDVSAIRPFLFNLFNDPAIIRVPKVVRYLLAQLISRKRAPVAAKIYDHLGGKSPLLENTQAQATALQAMLGEGFQAFICMRYWHPMTEAVVQDVMAYAPDRIVLLPLYPQFSTTTTASSVKQWQEIAEKQGLSVPTTTACCYPTHPDWIQAVAVKIAEKVTSFQGIRLLFSAHGLPESIVKKGDPYQWQVEQTVAAVVAALNVPDLDYQICYQSRVGPMTWIGPSTESAIEGAGAEKKGIVMIPIAFVSEHSETLVELDIEYRHLAEEAGVPQMIRIDTVGDHPLYIAALADVVKKTLACGGAVCPPPQRCPKTFSGCPCAA
jgi:ferrochelatase